MKSYFSVVIVKSCDISIAEQMAVLVRLVIFLKCYMFLGLFYYIGYDFALFAYILNYNVLSLL